MLQHLIQTIGDATGAWMYLIAAGLCFAEAAVLVGMVVPGETALLIGGVFTVHGDLNLPTMIVVGLVAAIAGDSVGFEFGRRFGPGLRRSRLGRRIGERRWSAAAAFLHRHGGKAVLLGRMTAVLRALVPSMAGMAGMRYRTFLTWNVLGAAVWAPGCVLLGYGFAQSVELIGRALTWVPLAILVLAAIAMIVVHRRRARTAQQDTAG